MDPSKTYFIQSRVNGSPLCSTNLPHIRLDDYHFVETPNAKKLTPFGNRVYFMDMDGKPAYVIADRQSRNILYIERDAVTRRVPGFQTTTNDFSSMQQAKVQTKRTQMLTNAIPRGGANTTDVNLGKRKLAEDNPMALVPVAKVSKVDQQMIQTYSDVMPYYFVAPSAPRVLALERPNAQSRFEMLPDDTHIASASQLLPEFHMTPYKGPAPTNNTLNFNRLLQDQMKFDVLQNEEDADEEINDKEIPGSFTAFTMIIAYFAIICILVYFLRWALPVEWVAVGGDTSSTTNASDFPGPLNTSTEL